MVKGAMALVAAMVSAFAGAQQPPGSVGGPPKASEATKAFHKPSPKELEVERTMRYALFLLESEHDYKGAIEQCAKVTRLDAKHVPSQVCTARAEMQLGEWQKAIKALQAVVKLVPRDRSAWATLGQAIRSSGDEEKALAAYEKALEIDRFFGPALLGAGDIVYNRFQKAPSDALKSRTLDLYDRFLKFGNESKGPLGARVERVLVAMRDGAAAADFLDARRIYDSAFASYSDFAPTMERAFALLEGVLAKKAGYAPALYYQGLIHLSVKSAKLHSVEKAREKLTAAGDYAPALVELGRLARTSDDLDGARKLLEQAVRVDERSQKGWLELGLVEKLADRRDGAATALRRAVDLDPSSDVAGKAIVELSILAPSDARVMAHFQTAGGFKGDVFGSEKFKGSIAILEQNLGGVDDAAPEAVWLDKMMRRLLAAGEVQVPYLFTVKVTRTEMINAFAVPNGNTYFTRGFLAFVKKTFPDVPMDENNAVVASVMGHEITHVIKEHVLRSFVFRDAMGTGRATPASLVTVTRTHEIEADRDGMKLMFLAGYDPRAAVQVMEGYAKVLGEVPRGLDHPTFDERVHYLEEYWSNEMAFAYASFHQGVARVAEAQGAEATDLNRAAGLYRDAIEDFRRFTVAFKRTRESLNNLGLAHAKLGLFELAKKDPKTPLARWYTEFSVEPTLALKFVPLASTGKTRGGAESDDGATSSSLRQARAYLDEAVKRDPGYARARFNRAVVQLATGEASEAEKALAALEGECGKPAGCGMPTDPIRQLLGVVRAEQGRMAEAVKAFEESLEDGHGTPAAPLPPRIFNLARALEGADRKSEAIAHYCRFLELVGDPDASPWAIQARTAIARLKE